MQTKEAATHDLYITVELMTGTQRRRHLISEKKAGASSLEPDVTEGAPTMNRVTAKFGSCRRD